MVIDAVNQACVLGRVVTAGVGRELHVSQRDFCFQFVFEALTRQSMYEWRQDWFEGFYEMSIEVTCEQHHCGILRPYGSVPFGSSSFFIETNLFFFYVQCHSVPDLLFVDCLEITFHIHVSFCLWKSWHVFVQWKIHFHYVWQGLGRKLADSAFCEDLEIFEHLWIWLRSISTLSPIKSILPVYRAVGPCDTVDYVWSHVNGGTWLDKFVLLTLAGAHLGKFVVGVIIYLDALFGLDTTFSVFNNIFFEAIFVNVCVRHTLPIDLFRVVSWVVQQLKASSFANAVIERARSFYFGIGYRCTTFAHEVPNETCK